VTQKDDAIVSLEQRKGDRRGKGEDRRKQNTSVAVERRTGERREKATRRRQIDPTTCERDYSIDEVEFMNAMNEYKRKSGRMFPTCSEILEVVRNLGYSKPGQLPPSAEPFIAPADADAADEAELLGK
jgi:hypothetical protein